MPPFLSKGGISYGNVLGCRNGFGAAVGVGAGADAEAAGAPVVGVGKALASGFCAAFTQAVKTKASATPIELCDAFMTLGDCSEPAFVSDVNRASDYADAHVSVEPSN